MKRYICLSKRIVPFSREFYKLQLLWQMAQKLSRNKRKTPGIRIKPREGLWINYQLKLLGVTHQNVADRLGIRRDTVTKIIGGIRHSTRIEEALYQTLGYASFEAMIADARGKGGAA